MHVRLGEDTINILAQLALCLDDIHVSHHIACLSVSIMFTQSLCTSFDIINTALIYKYDNYTVFKWHADKRLSDMCMYQPICIIQDYWLLSPHAILWRTVPTCIQGPGISTDPYMQFTSLSIQSTYYNISCVQCCTVENSLNC